MCCAGVWARRNKTMIEATLNIIVCWCRIIQTQHTQYVRMKEEKDTNNKWSGEKISITLSNTRIYRLPIPYVSAVRWQISYRNTIQIYFFAPVYE